MSTEPKRTWNVVKRHQPLPSYHQYSGTVSEINQSKNTASMKVCSYWVKSVAEASRSVRGKHDAKNQIRTIIHKKRGVMVSFPIQRFVVEFFSLVASWDLRRTSRSVSIVGGRLDDGSVSTVITGEIS